MVWLKRILLGLGLAFALLVGLVLAAGYFGGPSSGPATQTLSMTVGNHTVTVSGHYKSMAQESLGNGIRVLVDGHTIALDGEQLTVDGETQVLEPGQNVEVFVDKEGKVQVKVVRADTAGAGATP
jgi:hypothetical protein